MEEAPMQLPTAESVFVGVRKGAWTPEEDLLLKKCIERYGEGQWHRVPTRAGLRRCRKSCRLRWLNYLKPTIKRGSFDEDEVDLILRLHKLLGNRWSLIAGRIPGRTANDIKNYWNSSLGKRVSPNWQAVVDRKVTEGSTAVESLKHFSPCHPVGIRETPVAIIPSSVLKPQPRMPSKRAFPLSKTHDTCQKTSCEPSATDDKPAKEEDTLSWWRNFLEDNEGEGEGQQQQWEEENIVSFPRSSQAGGVELLHKSPWTEEMEGWGQWWLEDMFLDGDRPLGLLSPEVGANQASKEVHGIFDQW